MVEVEDALSNRLLRDAGQGRRRPHEDDGTPPRNDESAGDLLTGGGRLGGDLAEGFYIAPTVFGNVDNASHLAQNEIFGPVLSVLRFRTEAEAVQLANDTRYGLGGFLHTRDLARAHRVADGLAAGYVAVNGFPLLPPNAPVGPPPGDQGSGGSWPARCRCPGSVPPAPRAAATPLHRRRRKPRGAD